MLSDVITFVANSVGEFGLDGEMSWIVKFEGSVLTACWVSRVPERSEETRRRARGGG